MRSSHPRLLDELPCGLLVPLFQETAEDAAAEDIARHLRLTSKTRGWVEAEKEHEKIAGSSRSGFKVVIYHSATARASCIRVPKSQVSWTFWVETELPEMLGGRNGILYTWFIGCSLVDHFSPYQAQRMTSSFRRLQSDSWKTRHHWHHCITS